MAESWEKSIGGNRTQAEFEAINARPGVDDFGDFLNEAGIKHIPPESTNPQHFAANFIKEPKFTVVSYGDGQIAKINGTKYKLDHLVAVKRVRLWHRGKFRMDFMNPYKVGHYQTIITSENLGRFTRIGFLHFIK